MVLIQFNFKFYARNMIKSSQIIKIYKIIYDGETMDSLIHNSDVKWFSKHENKIIEIR